MHSHSIFLSREQPVMRFHIWDQSLCRYMRVTTCTRHVNQYAAMWHYLSNRITHYKHPAALHCSYEQQILQERCTAAEACRGSGDRNSFFFFISSIEMCSYSRRFTPAFDWDCKRPTCDWKSTEQTGKKCSVTSTFHLCCIHIVTVNSCDESTRRIHTVTPVTHSHCIAFTQWHLWCIHTVTCDTFYHRQRSCSQSGRSHSQMWQHWRNKIHQCAAQFSWPAREY